MTLLRVEKIGKAYRRYASEFLRVLSWFGWRFNAQTENWVLRDVSFTIAEGEAVGLVGQNGAGKSTLLKLISGTLQPTEGQVEVNGRIAAILELGMAFNAELTGRQNVKHTAGLMGFTAEQVEQVLPAIEAFADVGAYFDRPVRTYSSGMQVRVAFAVATAIRPQILIVDEALSVGDLLFQHKCFERIRQFREQGTTLLIVSHDHQSILSLCDRAILLEKGRVLLDARSDEVMDYYNAMIAEREVSTIEVRRNEDGVAQTCSGTREASIQSVSLLGSAGTEIDTVLVGETVELCVSVAVEVDLQELAIGYVIKDRLGQQVFGTNTYYLDCVQRDLTAGELFDCSFNFTVSLGEGSYSIAIALHSSESHLERNYEWRDMALLFSVVNMDKPKFVGSAWLPARVECTR